MANQSSPIFKFPAGVGSRQGLKSPIGIAMFPKLTEPDAKFGEPAFSTGLIFKPEDPAFKALEAEVLKAHGEAVAYYEANGPKQHDSKGKPKPVKVCDPPVGVHLDRDKNPTGDMVAKFKMKATYKPKDGPPVAKKLPIYDGKAKPWPKGVPFDGGSRLRVYYDIVPYAIPALGVGVQLRMSAVVVIEAKTWGPRVEAEEDYVAPDCDTAVTTEVETEGTEISATPPTKAGDF